MTDGVVLGDWELPFELPKTLAELRRYLQGALEIEHLTIPPYLTAMYTIRAAPTGTPTTRSAASSWRRCCT